MRTGLILAAGQSARFSGLYKDLLPIAEGKSVIDCSVDALRVWGAERIVVITNPYKYDLHAKHFSKYTDIDIQFKYQRGVEMWGAIETYLSEATTETMMLMADTIVNPAQFVAVPNEYHLAFGVFRTHSPERFSVFLAGDIITKPQELRGQCLTAWGCVYFTDKVAKFWLENTFTHYDQAFNYALRNGVAATTFTISPYYDLGNFHAYADYIRKNTA